VDMHTRGVINVAKVSECENCVNKALYMLEYLYVKWSASARDRENEDARDDAERKHT